MLLPFSKYIQHPTEGHGTEPTRLWTPALAKHSPNFPLPTGFLHFLIQHNQAHWGMLQTRSLDATRLTNSEQTPTNPMFSALSWDRVDLCIRPHFTYFLRKEKIYFSLQFGCYNSRSEGPTAWNSLSPVPAGAKQGSWSEPGIKMRERKGERERITPDLNSQMIINSVSRTTIQGHGLGDLNTSR